MATQKLQTRRRVLVVDDEENIRLVLETLLARHGYDVETAASAEAALARIEAFAPAFVIADVRMPGMTGIELCQALRERGVDATIIVMSAYGSVEQALEAIKAGAYDYVAKPFKQDEILFVLAKAEEREALRRENRALRETVDREQKVAGLLGDSGAMREVHRLIQKVGEYRTTVLIQGESGTGKELVARALHTRSPRVDNAFVAINCGAIPENLMESELFGHTRGAFTGANDNKAGLFEAADGGTLFLDEIGELSPRAQAKLLRVIQEGEIRRVGESFSRKVDVRIVAATNRRLEQEAAAGRFRVDLRFRIDVIRIVVPPLRARVADIPLLAAQFWNEAARRVGSRATLSPDALAALSRYDWPGNVRELQNVIAWMAVHSPRRGRIGAAALPAGIAGVLPAAAVTFEIAREDFERRFIRSALARANGHRPSAAAALGITRQGLAKMMRRLRIDERARAG